MESKFIESFIDFIKEGKTPVCFFELPKRETEDTPGISLFLFFDYFDGLNLPELFKNLPLKSLSYDKEIKDGPESYLYGIDSAESYIIKNRQAEITVGIFVKSSTKRHNNAIQFYLKKDIEPIDNNVIQEINAVFYAIKNTILCRLSKLFLHSHRPIIGHQEEQPVLFEGHEAQEVFLRLLTDLPFFKR